MELVTMILTVILNNALSALAIWLVAQHRPDWLVFVVVIVMLLTANKLHIKPVMATDKQEEAEDEPSRVL